MNVGACEGETDGVALHEGAYENPPAAHAAAHAHGTGGCCALPGGVVPAAHQ